jgi:hypothetical protein
VPLAAIFHDYFKFCHNQPYSFFHEETFWKRLAENALPHYLILAIMANALRFSTLKGLRGDAASLAGTCANLSWKSIVSHYFQQRADADIKIVQTITLLSIFDFTGEGQTISTHAHLANYVLICSRKG